MRRKNPREAPEARRPILSKRQRLAEVRYSVRIVATLDQQARHVEVSFSKVRIQLQRAFERHARFGVEPAGQQHIAEVVLCVGVVW